MLLLVENNAGTKRYVGEFDEAVLKTCVGCGDEDEHIEQTIGDLPVITLKNAYELVRLQIMTPNGPVMAQEFMAIAGEGPRTWDIACPSGWGEVSDLDPMAKRYMASRAEDANIVVANSVPSTPAPGGGGIITGRLKQ